MLTALAVAPPDSGGGFLRLTQTMHREAASMLKHGHKNALSDAKSAVRAYAKDPSDTNAERVETAWNAVKRLRAAANWQRRGQDQ